MKEKKGRKITAIAPNRQQLNKAYKIRKKSLIRLLCYYATDSSFGPCGELLYKMECLTQYITIVMEHLIKKTVVTTQLKHRTKQT